MVPVFTAALSRRWLRRALDRLLRAMGSSWSFPSINEAASALFSRFDIEVRGTVP
jgi:hypothetical protein